jgi:hypothetical protein
MNPPPKGAQALMQTLVNCGVEVCFANPGTSEMHFVAALSATTPPITCSTTRADDGAREAGRDGRDLRQALVRHHHIELERVAAAGARARALSMLDPHDPEMNWTRIAEAWASRPVAPPRARNSRLSTRRRCSSGGRG